MHLTPIQWNELEAIFLRTPQDDHMRSSLLIALSREVRKTINDAPFASLATIPDAPSFFEMLRDVVERSNERALSRTLVGYVSKQSLNTTDVEKLKSWIEHSNAQRSQDQVDEEGTTIGNPSTDCIGSSSTQSSESKESNCVQDTIAKVLGDAPGLLRNLVASNLLALAEDRGPDAVARALCSPENDELPIKLLNSIVRKWDGSRESLRFDAKDSDDFHAVKDLLVIRSLPDGDRGKLVAAIQRAKNFLSQEAQNAPVPCGVSKTYEDEKGYLQRLVHQLWCQSKSDPELAAEHLKLLFHPKPADGKKQQRILRLVRFLKEPSVASDGEHFSGLSIRDVAQHIYQEFTLRNERLTDPLQHLQEVIIPDHCTDEGGLLVMFVSDRRTMNSYLQLLNDALPEVLCIELQSEVGNQYATVTYFVEKILEYLPAEYATIGVARQESPRAV